MKYFREVKHSIILKQFCALFLVSAAGLQPASAQASSDTAFIQVNAGTELADLQPAWAWFGYDEPNYTYMKDGKKLLTELAALSPVPVYVRTHNLLTTGDGKRL